VAGYTRNLRPVLEQPTPTHSPENPDGELKRLRERVAEQTALIALCASVSGSWKRA